MIALLVSVLLVVLIWYIVRMLLGAHPAPVQRCQPSPSYSNWVGSRESPTNRRSPAFVLSYRTEPTPTPLTAEASRRAARAWLADRTVEQTRACPWLQRL